MPSVMGPSDVPSRNGMGALTSAPHSSHQPPSRTAVASTLLLFSSRSLTILYTVYFFTMRPPQQGHSQVPYLSMILEWSFCGGRLRLGF